MRCLVRPSWRGWRWTRTPPSPTTHPSCSRTKPSPRCGQQTSPALSALRPNDCPLRASGPLKELIRHVKECSPCMPCLLQIFAVNRRSLSDSAPADPYHHLQNSCTVCPGNLRSVIFGACAVKRPGGKRSGVQERESRAVLMGLLAVCTGGGLLRIRHADVGDVHEQQRMGQNESCTGCARCAHQPQAGLARPRPGAVQVSAPPRQSTPDLPPSRSDAGHHLSEHLGMHLWHLIGASIAGNAGNLLLSSSNVNIDCQAHDQMQLGLSLPSCQAERGSTETLSALQGLGNCVHGIRSGRPPGDGRGRGEAACDAHPVVHPMLCTSTPLSHNPLA